MSLNIVLAQATASPSPASTPAALVVHAAQVGTNGLWGVPLSIGLTVGVLIALRCWGRQTREWMIATIGASVGLGLVGALVVYLFRVESVTLEAAQLVSGVYGIEAALVVLQIGLMLLAGASSPLVKYGASVLAASLAFLVVDRLVLQHNYDQLDGDTRAYYYVLQTASAPVFLVVHIGVRPYYLVDGSQTTSVQVLPTAFEPQDLQTSGFSNLPPCNGQIDFGLINEKEFDKIASPNLPMTLPIDPPYRSQIWRWMLSPRSSGRQQLEFVGTMTEKGGGTQCVANKQVVFFDQVEQVAVWTQWFELDQSTKFLALITSILAALSTIVGLVVPKASGGS